MKFFAVLLLLCSVAKANYNSIIIGDQAAGMGGAYVAMPEDASAHGWYNPANLARLTGKSFSASVGVYKKFDTRFGDVEDITKATLRANQGFFQPLPSSLGSVLRFKEQLPDWTMAMSILTPHYDSFSGYVSNTETNTSRLSQIDQTLWVGGVIAKPVSASESIGISLYYLAHNYARNVSVTTALGGNQVRTYLEEKTFYQNSIVAILGYTKELNDKVVLATSVRLSPFHIAGKGSYSSVLIDSTGTNEQVNLPSLDSRTKIPMRWSFGGTYKKNERLIYSAQLDLYSKEVSRDVEDNQAGELLEYNALINGSFGLEWKYREDLKFRTGVFTNLSPFPNPEVGKVRGQGDRVDQLGWAANIAFKTGNLQYTFGGYYTGGRGQSVQRMSNESLNSPYERVNKAKQVFTMLIGTSYNF